MGLLPFEKKKEEVNKKQFEDIQHYFWYCVVIGTLSINRYE